MESQQYLIKMVMHPRAHGYSQRIDVEKILASEGEGRTWRLKKALGYSLSDRELHDIFRLKDSTLWSGFFL